MTLGCPSPGLDPLLQALEVMEGGGSGSVTCEGCQEASFCFSVGPLQFCFCHGEFIQKRQVENQQVRYIIDCMCYVKT